MKRELSYGPASRHYRPSAVLLLAVVGCGESARRPGIAGDAGASPPALGAAHDGGAGAPACSPPLAFGAVPSDVAASAMIDADETSFYFAAMSDGSGTFRQSFFALPLAGGHAELISVDVSIEGGGGLRVHQGFMTYYDRFTDGHFKVLHLLSRTIIRDFDPGEGLGPATWDADFDSVAWLTAAPGGGAILSRRRWGDGLVETLATVATPAGDVPPLSALTIDAGQVFWLANRSSGEAALWTWDPVSRRAFVLAQGRPSHGEPNGRLAVDEGFVYFERADGGGISTVPRAGGTARPLAEVPEGSSVLSSPIVDDRFVYWKEVNWKEDRREWRAIAKSGEGGPFSIGMTVAECDTAVRGGTSFSCGPSGRFIVPTKPVADDAKIWQVPAWWRDCKR